MAPLLSFSPLGAPLPAHLMALTQCSPVVRYRVGRFAAIASQKRLYYNSSIGICRENAVPLYNFPSASIGLIIKLHGDSTTYCRNALYISPEMQDAVLKSVLEVYDGAGGGAHHELQRQVLPGGASGATDRRY